MQNNAASFILAAALRASGLLSPEAQAQARQLSLQTHAPLLQTLLHHHLLRAEQIAKMIADFLGQPYADLYVTSIAADIPKIFLEWIHAKKFPMLPVAWEKNILIAAISDPETLHLLDCFAFHFHCHVKIILVTHPDLMHHLHQIQSKQRYQQFEALESLEEILSDAIHRRASDIHFEPFEFDYRIRMRIDGVLHEIVKPPLSLAGAIGSSLKIMANLNIAEKRLPQDGRLTFTTHKKMTRDCRVSVCPTLYGEKIVVRILESNPALLKLSALGMSDKEQMLFQKAIARPQGLILVTGPTGSGKTVTLYTALSLLNTPEKNISTIEDPIEIKLQGINQVQVNGVAGLDFATALRAFLRQDPDVIMIGEIRDTETAEIAMKAAETGHLVLATLHTNNTLETIQRLQHLHIDVYSILNSTLLIIAQRLVRKICTECKQVGCAYCENGYHGRVGVYEFLPLAIDGTVDPQQLEKKRIRTLRASALEKVRMSVTSLAEAERVT